ncbi:MAG: 4Fe-4S dicluster domain-containing protein [Acidimicrobiia bacterium]|nr:4Fe-4S dicluster domain-containing protein [Acidimicrobiia bacterium]
MAHDAAPLTPFPLDLLVERIHHEWSSRKRVFDLPTARFFDVTSGPDLSADFMGRRAATPIGPAAGPHTQLAENIVLGWLGGARIFELKTVQILDELEIARPCIDMQTIGYNIEWSQELKISQSIEEYTKAWMLIEILRQWDELTPFLGPDPGPHIFDISVGYDLAGIQSDPVAGFIDAMTHGRAEIERLRPLLRGGPFDAFADLEFPESMADTATLSTFHGCPPDEIESISKHLMTRHGLDVVVKLNPTLLGFDAVSEIVIGELGYDEVRLRNSDFDADLQFDRGVELIGELTQFASERGRSLGVKLTNTLVVENHRGFLPDDTMYLSGAPLHVVSMTLLQRLHEALPGMLRVEGANGPVQVSWSAGITKDNFPAAAGLGLTPVTVCSDLLKPGGYGRLKPMLTALQKAIEASGLDDLSDWVAGAGGSVADYVRSLRDPATNQAYTREGTSKLPRAVDHTLEMWGCVACNFCVTVCPNDAFFRVPTPENLDVSGRQQYFVLAELCNECGNCLVFCPEEGDPALVKPRLFLDENRFAAARGQAFLLSPADGGWSATAKPGYGEHTDRLTQVLGDPEGLPFWSEA